MLKTALAYIFVETVIFNLFEMEMFTMICPLKVFTVTSDQFNLLLLNKERNITDHRLWMLVYLWLQSKKKYWPTEERKSLLQRQCLYLMMESRCSSDDWNSNRAGMDLQYQLKWTFRFFGIMSQYLFNVKQMNTGQHLLSSNCRLICCSWAPWEFD